MHQIPIPDPLYVEAQRVAVASGMSVERFVREAVQLHLTDELDEPRTLKLTDDQMAKVRQAQAEVKSGKFLTMEQVDQRHAANRAAWLENRP